MRLFGYGSNCPCKNYRSDSCFALRCAFLGMAPFAVWPFRSRYRYLLVGPPLCSFHHTRVYLTAKTKQLRQPGLVKRQRQDNSESTTPSPSLVRRGILFSLLPLLTRGGWEGLVVAVCLCCGSRFVTCSIDFVNALCESWGSSYKLEPAKRMISDATNVEMASVTRLPDSLGSGN